MDIAGLRQIGTLDVVIVALLAVGFVLGIFQGVIRQVFFLASVYFGMVLSAQYYQLAARGLAWLVPGGDSRSYSVVGLLAVFVATMAGINILSHLAYGPTRIPMLAVVERLGGAGLGLLSAWVFATLLLTATEFALSVPISGLEWAQTIGLRIVDDSALAPTLHHAMPALYETIRPWVPAGLPAPFSV